jgi:hypothetical protein
MSCLHTKKHVHSSCNWSCINATQQLCLTPFIAFQLPAACCCSCCCYMPCNMQHFTSCSGPKRCLQSLLVVICFLTVEVNSFFLKYALWIHPPWHTLVWGRLLLWTLVGAPAVREYYEFIEGGTASQALTMAGGVVFHKLGTFAWVAVAVSGMWLGGSVHSRKGWVWAEG